MDRLFLDSNVLFSAVYRPEAGVVRLWRIPGVELLTSTFALEAIRRNLAEEDQRKRLGGLLEQVQVGEALMLPPERRGEIVLPEKDWPILGSAAVSGASHLITGDLRHFGPYFGQEVLGVLITRPADYLKSRL